MSIYSLALFVHVISDITLFIGIGAQLLTLSLLRRAKQADQVRSMVGLITITDWIGVSGALLTIASGVYLALTVWSLQTSWIRVALASIILLIGPLIGGVVEPRTRAITKMAKEIQEGPIPEPLSARIHDPVLGTALQTNLMIVIGIVFLMTTKPSWPGAIAAMAGALVLGVMSGIPLLVRRTRAT